MQTTNIIDERFSDYLMVGECAIDRPRQVQVLAIWLKPRGGFQMHTTTTNIFTTKKPNCSPPSGPRWLTDLS